MSMIRKHCWGLAAAALLGCSTIAFGQATIPAFPGAEGAGKFAFGGRGGDVYVVTNLNNTGAGSLRNGITTATGPRTIVFGVSGEINLSSDLSISGKNKLTIAGQTAPAGGITLKGRNFRINNSNDIVVQHLRVRPGNINTGGDGGPGTGYAPDSVSVTGGNRIVLDHITASWSTDEVFSVTDNAQNVSVQWSMISEALHLSNHPEGQHGFGSLLRARNVTFHHNLYAHNWSRNPRPGSIDEGTNVANAGTYDFVNNVIYNPGNKYGYTEAEATFFNWVGNVGLRGPNTIESDLMDSGSLHNRIYVRDNYIDSFADGFLSPLPAGAQSISGDYTPLASRQPITEITNEVAPTLALNQVLSYAGASAWRDSADKRVIGNVFNSTGSIINTQNTVGGFPTLPSNTAIPDPDGLPNWWKEQNGLDPNDNSIGLQPHPDGSGYTYLERYLHELNAPYLPRTQSTTQVAIGTDFGAGADAQVSENFDLSSGIGDAADLNVSWNGAAGNLNEYTLLRFDLSQVERGSITSASLELTAFANLGSRIVKVYGLLPDSVSDEWAEDSVEFDGAPGLAFDGESGTQGRLPAEWLNLGQFNTGGTLEGSTIVMNQVALASFLNQLTYREADDMTVTLALERSSTQADSSRFASKEATHLASTAPGSVAAGTYAPRLVLDAILLPDEGLDGDFDGDFDVDGDDFLYWQIHLQDPGSLALWETNYGTVQEPPPLSAASVVPEPSTLVLVIAAIVVAVRRRTHI